MRITKLACATSIGLAFAFLASCSQTGSKLADANQRASAAWTQTVGNNLPAEANVALLEKTTDLPKDKHGFPTYLSLIHI